MSDRILIAVRPEDDALVAAVLEGYFDFTIRHTLGEAVEALNEPLGLIVCGVHFDRGAMFDLLAAAKSHPATGSTPFFLVLREETKYSASVVAGIRKAATLQGVDTFIDMGEMRSQMDRAQMLEGLRDFVRDVIPEKIRPATTV